MMMTSKSLFLTASLFAVGLFASCSSENTGGDDHGKEKEIGHLTVFSTEDEAVSAKPGMTRTTGIYNGTKINFFWTQNDKLWIKDGANLIKNAEDNITGVQASAKFYYSQTLTNPSYPVRFTGTNASAGDKVTIAANQTQAQADNAAHIGNDGDCGTAVATLTNGIYEFHLKHQAAYVTFTPWYGKEELASTVSVTAIKLTIDAASNVGKNIAGTFNFNDSGLGTLISNGSRSITLTLTNGFPVPKVADHLKNAATMVVYPGNYNNVTISYTLKDTKTGVTGIVSQTYPSMTFNAGKNRPISKKELDMNNYKPNYYQWDAGKPYWNGYTGTIPVVNGEKGNYQPAYGSDRYMNSNSTVFNGNNICASAPNVNEATLYSFFGDSHWDGDIIWTMNKHLYKGGMWFLKLNKISTGTYSGFTHPVTNIHKWQNNYIPSSSNTYWNAWSETNVGTVNAEAWTTNVKHTGRPTNVNNYFFLPAMGYLKTNGTFVLGDNDKYGYYASYWTSNGLLLGIVQGLSFHFNDKKVGVNIDDRLWAYPVFDATTYQLK
ncbi:hypothetical protein [Hoylesella enoeca]|nr:hypothetical protein [Hoylesella enoeca]